MWNKNKNVEMETFFFYQAIQVRIDWSTEDELKEEEESCIKILLIKLY